MQQTPELHMIKIQRRKFTAEFKAKVVIELINGRQTLSEVAKKFDLNKNQISNWRKEFFNNANKVLESDTDNNEYKLVSSK